MSGLLLFFFPSYHHIFINFVVKACIHHVYMDLTFNLMKSREKVSWTLIYLVEDCDVQ